MKRIYPSLFIILKSSFYLFSTKPQGSSINTYCLLILLQWILFTTVSIFIFYSIRWIYWFTLRWLMFRYKFGLSFHKTVIKVYILILITSQMRTFMNIIGFHHSGGYSMSCKSQFYRLTSMTCKQCMH